MSHELVGKTKENPLNKVLFETDNRVECGLKGKGFLFV